MSTLALDKKALRTLSRAEASPAWLKVVALAAVRADKSGVAVFAPFELRKLLRCQSEDMASVASAERSIERAMDLGLIAECVGLVQLTLARGLTPIRPKVAP